MSNTDNRDGPKNIARLHIDLVFIGGQDMPGHKLQAVTHSVSMEGVTVLSDHNFRANQELHLRLHIPATHVGDAERYVIARGKVNYSIYDSSAEEFRTYVRFQSFNDSASKALLAQKLE